MSSDKTVDSTEGTKMANMNIDNAPQEEARLENGGSKETSLLKDNAENVDIAINNSSPLVTDNMSHNSEDEVERSTLFKQGQALEQDGKQDMALKLYLQSLTGIQEQISYPELPQCLHQVSQIYFAKNEYEKAVHFIQAEKMFYETALIDAAKLHLQYKNAQETTKSDDILDGQEAVKAKQFEELSRLCKEEGNLYLALDYCGKATKMYRSLYGEEHPTTKQALDLFTIIYADVGKKQYAEAMQKSQSEGEPTEKVHTILPRLAGDANQTGPRATLKKRSSFDSKEKAEERKRKGLRKVRFEEEYEPTPIKDDQDDVIMTSLMMILFVLCTIFFALIGSYMYCHNKTATSPMCASLKSDLSYYFMQMQYTYKHYFK